MNGRLPLQVYLDSSDFSCLANPRARSEEISNVEKLLLGWRDANLIDIRFSYAHVIEAAPTAPEHLEFAKLRLECIKRLCQSNVVVAPSILMEHEVRQICLEEKAEIEVLRSDGFWIPMLPTDDLGFEPPEEMVRKEIANLNLGRAERRKWERIYFDSSGRLSAAATTLLKKSLPDSIAEIQRKYPLTDDALRVVSQYFLGRGSQRDLTNVLVSSISDLTAYSRWLEAQWDKLNPTLTWLRASGDSVRNSLLESIEKLREIAEHLQFVEIAEDEINRRNKELFEQVHKNLFPSVVNRIAEGLKISSSASAGSAPWSLAPGLYAATELMMGLGGATLLSRENPRLPKRSDLGDVLHSIYLPYVDIFRADGFISNVLRSIKLPFGTRVVDSFLQLPRVIEEEIAVRRVV